MIISDENPIPSLFELCKRTLIRNVDSLDNVGDLPYSLVRPVLLKIEAPPRLEILEANCPQLRGDTMEIWKTFIRRDFGQEALESMEPKDPRNWNKVYNKLKRAQARKDKHDIAILKEAMENLKNKKEQRKVKLVPRERLRNTELASLRRVDAGARSSGSGWGEGSKIEYKSALRSNCVRGKNSDYLRRTTNNGIFKSAALNKILRGRR